MDNFRIEPVFNLIYNTGTAVTEYKVVDENGTIWFTGTHSECEIYKQILYYGTILYR